MVNQDFYILLVEDCPGDVGLIRHVLRGHGVQLTVTSDGEKALAHLSNPDVLVPDLILLDLNLPRRSGFDVLKHVRGQDRLRRVPVAVLTSSSAERDVEAAYNLGANCYIVKPISFEEFDSVVSRTVSFWQSCAARPLRGASQTAS